MADPIIRFGTDGWRGKIAEEYTFDAVRRCAQGLSSYLRQSMRDEGSVVVGYDMRFGSEAFAVSAAEVLAGNGFHVYLTDRPTPTPVISYSVVNKGCLGAVNITASHNPPEDNGFKVRDETGGAVNPEGLKEIEASIPPKASDIPRVELEQALKSGQVERFDPGPEYLDQINRLVDIEPLKAAGYQVLVDAMWGNGAGWFSKILEGGKTQVMEIHDRRNPIFPEMTRPEPIPPNIDVGLARVKELGADILLVTDGDADRVGLGDEFGEFVDQLRVYALLAYYMLEVRGERGPIVKTLSTTSMLDKLGKLYGVEVFETGVGFKYVAPKMTEVGAMIGGEESGGYAFQHHVPERDGILAGLYLLDMMVQLQAKPSELIDILFDKVGPHYYDRIDTPLDQEKKAEYRKNIERAKPKEIAGLEVEDIVTIDGYKYVLEDGGWLLIRFSGTEPIVRVYCETTSKDNVQPILRAGLEIVGIR